MTFFITPFHYTDCFSVRQIGYGGNIVWRAADGQGYGADERNFLRLRNVTLELYHLPEDDESEKIVETALYGTEYTADEAVLEDGSLVVVYYNFSFIERSGNNG